MAAWSSPCSMKSASWSRSTVASCVTICARVYPSTSILPGPHVGVFNLAGVQEAGRREVGQRDVILWEALIDALTFWCHGFTHVTSSYGIEGFTPDILQALKDNAIERVLIVYARDAARSRASFLRALRSSWAWARTCSSANWAPGSCPRSAPGRLCCGAPARRSASRSGFRSAPPCLRRLRHESTRCRSTWPGPPITFQSFSRLALRFASISGCWTDAVAARVLTVRQRRTPLVGSAHRH
jgi:hypothetical protein